MQDKSNAVGCNCSHEPISLSTAFRKHIVGLTVGAVAAIAGARIGLAISSPPQPVQACPQEPTVPTFELPVIRF